jgi:hypothetical protein
MQGKVLAQLRDRLRNATALLDGLIGGQAQPRTHEDSNILSRMEGLAVMSPYRKFKYGTKKGALKEIVDDLEKWQSRYNPIWLLLVLIKSPRIDEACNFFYKPISYTLLCNRPSYMLPLLLQKSSF